MVSWSKNFEVKEVTSCLILTLVRIIENVFKCFIYLFLERGKVREKERERNIDV